MKTAIVSGSFDPMTNGHLWLIEEALRLADHVHVVVASNRNKQHLFSPGERRSQVQQSLKLMAGGVSRYSVDILPPTMLLVDFAADIECSLIVRGLRNTTDFEYEGNINLVQRSRAPHVQTVYLMTPREYTEVSSSLVRSLMGLNGWEDIVAKYVPAPVLAALTSRK